MSENTSNLQAIVNVEAAIVKNGHYLMITRGEQEVHAPGVLSLPGGKVDAAEGPHDDILEATIRREIHEEVGVVIHDDIEYVTSSFFVSDLGQPVVNIVFLCRYREGTPTIRDIGEVGSILWLTAEEVVQHPKSPPWTSRSIAIAERKRLRWMQANHQVRFGDDVDADATVR